MLTVRQVTAIAARIRDDLVGFIQRLGDIKGFLRAEAEFFRAYFLQGAEVERQGCGFAHTFGAQLDQSCAGSMAHGVGSLLRQWLIQAAILIITGVRRSAPLSDERLVVVQQFDVDGPEGRRYEICDAAIAVHHQTQGRGLHTADWQYALITRLAPQQCEQTAHVHADQPVCAGPAQCRVIQAEGVGAGLERCQRLANGGVIQRR